MSKFISWLSQAVNACLFDGHIDETLSARAWRRREEQEWSEMHRRIDGWFGLGHCKRAWEAQKQREYERRKGASQWR